MGYEKNMHDLDIRAACPSCGAEGSLQFRYPWEREDCYECKRCGTHVIHGWKLKQWREGHMKANEDRSCGLFPFKKRNQFKRPQCNDLFGALCEAK